MYFIFLLLYLFNQHPSLIRRGVFYMSTTVTRHIYDSAYIRSLDAVLPVKKSIRRCAIKLNFWKPSSECLASSLPVFKTPKWKDDNFVKNNVSKYEFSFGLWNCHSAGSKSCSLHDYITNHQFGLFGLTETWLGTDIDKTILKELLPPGYSIHHQPRLGGKSGGGASRSFI